MSPARQSTPNDRIQPAVLGEEVSARPSPAHLRNRIPPMVVNRIVVRRRRILGFRGAIDSMERFVFGNRLPADGTDISGGYFVLSHRPTSASSRAWPWMIAFSSAVTVSQVWQKTL